MQNSQSNLAEFRGLLGIPVEVSSSLLFLLLAFVGLGASFGGLVENLLFVAILVGSIYLHELGHGWACLVQGIPVRRIVLYAGGGFCEPARSASRQQQELIIAMGPLVNLFLWAASDLALLYVDHPQLWDLLYQLSWVNLWLALFNLLPLMPLDGGRLLNLALCRVMPAPTALRVSGAIGLILSVLFVPLMLLSFVMFGLILMFFPSFRLHWHMLRGRME